MSIRNDFIDIETVGGIYFRAIKFHVLYIFI